MRAGRRANSIEVFLRRRRRRRWLAWALALPAIALLIAADQRGHLLYEPAPGVPLSPAGRIEADTRRYDGGTFPVTRIIDGDTLEVGVGDGDQPVTRVRVLGIDAPEAKRVLPDGTVLPAEPWADQAAASARTLVAGGAVRLVLDPRQTRGFYGRLLAYVELDDRTYLGERLLVAGLARAERRWPHERSSRYALLELEAKKQGRGLWAASSR